LTGSANGYVRLRKQADVRTRLSSLEVAALALKASLDASDICCPNREVLRLTVEVELTFAEVFVTYASSELSNLEA
jgi:hypothetical protein